MTCQSKKLILFPVVDWFFFSHWVPIAKAAQKSGYEVIVVTSVSDSLEKFADMGVSIYDLNLSRSRLGFCDFSNLLTLIKIIRREKPEILHLIGLKPILLGTLASFFRRDIKLVQAVTGLGYLSNVVGFIGVLSRFLFRTIFSFLLGRRNCLVFVENTDLLNSLANNFSVSRDKIYLIPGAGVDISKYHPKEKPFAIPAMVIMVSRILKDKGVIEFWHAARILKSRGVQVKMVLVGGVDKENPASISEYELDQISNDSAIEYIGKKNNVHEIMEIADISVLPSYSEGLPKSLLESAACGLPLIATDVMGCREVVIDHENGFLVPPRDAMALANAISRLIDVPELAKKFGRMSRVRAETEYSESIVTQLVISAYDTLL